MIYPHFMLCVQHGGRCATVHATSRDMSMTLGPTMHVNFPPEVDAQRFRGHAVLIGAEEQSR